MQRLFDLDPGDMPTTEELLGLGGHLGEASSAADLLASLPA